MHADNIALPTSSPDLAAGEAEKGFVPGGTASGANSTLQVLGKEHGDDSLASRCELHGASATDLPGGLQDQACADVPRELSGASATDLPGNLQDQACADVHRELSGASATDLPGNLQVQAGTDGPRELDGVSMVSCTRGSGVPLGVERQEMA